jgi:hypothetical protein
VVTVEKEALKTDVLVNLWNDVIGAVNRILDADRKFGFSKIEANLNPSLDEIIHGLSFVDAALGIFLDSGLLDHDESRKALNSKQCVLHLRRLAKAVKDVDAEEYSKVISALDNQAQF